MGARLFYFITYGAFYGSLLWYNNPFRAILFFQKEDYGFGDFLFLVVYIAVHGAAIHYFMTAGENPGFVDETQTSLEAIELE